MAVSEATPAESPEPWKPKQRTVDFIRVDIEILIRAALEFGIPCGFEFQEGSEEEEEYHRENDKRIRELADDAIDAIKTILKTEEGIDWP